MERILDLAKKRCDKAEVFRVEKNSSPAMFYGGKLSALEGEVSVGTSLRVIVDGKLGFSSTTHPDEVEGLVDRAVRSAQFGPEFEVKFPTLVKDFGRGDYFDNRVSELSIPDMISTGNRMGEMVRGEFPEANLEIEVSKDIIKHTIMNTDGGCVSFEKTMYQAFLNVLLIMDEDRAELEHTFSSSHFSEGPIQIAKDAVWRFKNCHRVAPVSTKKMKVIFTSLGFRGLYVPLFYGLNGEMARKNMSRLSGRVGERVVNPAVTLIDDPTAPGMPASCPVDDEGVPTQAKTLIDKGVLKEYFYDLRSAALAGTASSGNGFKKSSLYTGFSVDSMPNPYPSNFILTPGNITRDAMIRNTEEGIIVDDTMGAGQGNNLNGEFSMNVALGYKIEHGEIVGRVKDVMVAGNIFDILENNLSSLTSESWTEDTLFGKYSAPWVAFDNMPVSAT